MTAVRCRRFQKGPGNSVNYLDFPPETGGTTDVRTVEADSTITAACLFMGGVAPADVVCVVESVSMYGVAYVSVYYRHRDGG